MASNAENVSIWWRHHGTSTWSSLWLPMSLHPMVPTVLMLSTLDKNMVRFVIQTMLSEVVNDILHGITSLKNHVAWIWKYVWYGSFSNCKILRGSYAFFVNVGEYCWLWYKSHLFVTQTFSTKHLQKHAIIWLWVRSTECDCEFKILTH